MGAVAGSVNQLFVESNPLLNYVRITMVFFALMEYKTWMCVICGFVYDEELGLPEEGLAPGTRWADIPENWQCPDCDATKIDFEMIEI